MVEGVCDFSRFFEIVEADTEALRHEVYRIRHRVYVDELGWEAAGGQESQEETDIYDRRAIFCLLKHLATGRFIGCLRLVLADPLDPKAAFPFEALAPLATRALAARHGEFWRVHAAEISRTAVIGDFRRRGAERLSPISESNGERPDPGQSLHDERRGFPHIAAGLYIGAAALGMAHQMARVFALMEPRLARRLRVYGIQFDQLGPPVEHHGQRAPYGLEASSFERGLSSDLSDLLWTIRPTLAARRR